LAPHYKRHEVCLVVNPARRAGELKVQISKDMYPRDLLVRTVVLGDYVGYDITALLNRETEVLRAEVSREIHYSVNGVWVNRFWFH
jgi:hypothetical protein